MGQYISLITRARDYVALQVGDIAPAMCVSLRTDHHLNEGERFEHFATDKEFSPASIPSGRTTIPPNSQVLLSLCNLMEIFVVKEAPIEKFLRRPSGPASIPASPSPAVRHPPSHVFLFNCCVCRKHGLYICSTWNLLNGSIGDHTCTVSGGNGKSSHHFTHVSYAFGGVGNC
jgi:hypothetical protein